MRVIHEIGPFILWRKEIEYVYLTDRLSDLLRGIFSAVMSNHIIVICPWDIY